MYLQPPLRCSRGSSQVFINTEYTYTSTHTRMSPTTHLTTSMMPQVLPIHVKLAMIVHMHEFMCKCILHMLLAPEMTFAEGYCTCGMESAGTGEVARGTDDAGGRDGAARQTEVVEHEYDFWACSRYGDDYGIYGPWYRSEEGTVRTVVEQFCFPLLTTCVFLLFEVTLSFFCARAETSDLCCFVLPSLERAVVVVPESSWYIYSNPRRPSTLALRPDRTFWVHLVESMRLLDKRLDIVLVLSLRRFQSNHHTHHHSTHHFS